MEWTQRSRWFIESDKGYRVSKAIGKDGTIYTAWTPSREALIYTPLLQEAKNACEADCKAENRDMTR
jgi:hypothetical protein